MTECSIRSYRKWTFNDLSQVERRGNRGEWAHRWARCQCVCIL